MIRCEDILLDVHLRDVIDWGWPTLLIRVGGGEHMDEKSVKGVIREEEEDSINAEWYYMTDEDQILRKGINI